MHKTVVEEAEARVGRTLCGKWHLDSLIDIGGMAGVYAATHRNGLRGAVKVLHRSCLAGAERFKREGYIANRVDHPAALRVLDDDVDEAGHPFLVMELLDGCALHERAAQQGGKLGPEEVMLVVDELLDLLVTAHEQGIVHRDIKPENIFLTKSGDVRLLDFGIARLQVTAPTEDSRTQTVEGITMGTPAFMSPEQARARWDLLSGQSDLWSTGATMFTLLSGHFVHEEETAAEMLAASFTKPAPLLVSVLPDVHPALAKVVDGALERSLAERWPDAATMRVALRTAYRSMFGHDLPGRPKVRSPRVSDASGPGNARALAQGPGAETMAATETAALQPTPRRGRGAVTTAAVFGLAVLIAAGGSAWTLGHPRELHASQSAPLGSSEVSLPAPAPSPAALPMSDPPAMAPPASAAATPPLPPPVASAPTPKVTTTATTHATTPARPAPPAYAPYRSLYDRRY